MDGYIKHVGASCCRPFIVDFTHVEKITFTMGECQAQKSCQNQKVPILHAYPNDARHKKQDMRQGEEASSLSPGGAFPATTSTIAISPPKMAFTRWREGEPPKLKQFLHFVPGQAWSVGASTKFDRDIKVCYNRAKSYNSHLGSVASRRGAAGKSPQPPFSKGKKGVRQDIIERGTTLAVIVGNRDFFPDVLVTEGRKEILSVLDEMPAV